MRLDELRKLAEAATSGPWKVNKYGSVGVGEFGADCAIAFVAPLYGDDEKYGSHSANRAYIAAANPAAVLQLIAVAEAAKASVAAYDALQSTPIGQFHGGILPACDAADVILRAALSALEKQEPQ